jgi:hypothetical protein
MDRAVPSSDVQPLPLLPASNAFSLRAKLKRFPALVRMKKAVRGALYGFDSEILGRFPLFQPWSAGRSEALEKLTVLAANQTFPLMAQLLTKIGKDNLALIRADDFCGRGESRETSTQLKQLFDKHGSDKSAEHDYHLVYGPILNRPESVTAILEIGLGSHNDDIVSNMGRQGKPGASLRAFREFLPNAQIYGADVDKRILFQEDRIRTYFVDQTNLESFDALGTNVAASLDLIIDDGLHSPNANIAVLIFGLSRLKIGGWLVVEDIPKSALPVWKVVGALLPAEQKPYLVEANGGALVFAVQRIA